MPSPEDEFGDQNGSADGSCEFTVYRTARGPEFTIKGVAFGKLEFSLSYTLGKARIRELQYFLSTFETNDG
jgi:hypothetical protein